MGLGSLKFWRKHKRRGDSSTSSTISAGTGAVQPPRTAIPDRRPASRVPSSLNDTNVVSISDDAPDLQGNPTIPYRALDSMPHSSQNALSTDGSDAPLASLSPIASSKSSSGSLLERLWNEAYDGLKTQDQLTVQAYEKLLVERLAEIHNGPRSPVATQITTSMLKQPKQLERFVAAGLERSKSIATTKKNMEEFSRIAQPVKAVMDVVVQAAPQAALPWSCISFTLQILANPLTESSINREGIAYVLMTMKWYQKLVDLLIEDDNQLQELRKELEKYIVELYKKLLLYQMKSVCYYYRRQIYVFFGDLVKFDDWTGKLTDVKEAEENVRVRLEQYQSLSIHESVKSLASDIRHEFDALASAIQEQTRTQQKSEKRSERERCLTAFRQKVDPHDEKARIQTDKGGILRDCYSWILGHKDYQSWYHNKSNNILWITGDPGKGKTMLLCGIIDELEKEPTDILSYFFCQATQTTLSNATDVLRGLIYGIAKRYRQLDHYIYDSYKDGGGEAVFSGQSAWVVMCRILKAMLADPAMEGALLIVDALDECVEGRQKLLDFICETSLAVDSRAKWIMSSRNWLEIEKAMSKVKTHTSTLSLEMNDNLVADAVRKYVRQKMVGLAEEPPFKGDQNLCDAVMEHLNKNSGHTFLWVALVCNALSQDDVLRPEHVLGPKGILKESPEGLDNLYDRMLGHISDSRDADLCKDVLAVASVLKRHVTPRELCSIMGLSTHFDGKVETLEYVVRRCGSFLNIRDGTIYFVHQSARDFLHNKERYTFSLIFPRGIRDVQQMVFSSSLDSISGIIRRDIYGLEDFYGLQALGMHRDDITPPQPDPLASIKYACIYWIDHLSESDFSTHIEDHGIIHRFLQAKLLYWLEALTLLRQLPQAVQGIQKLLRLVDGEASPTEQSLSEFVRDANRFLLYHRVMIENNPLQLYASALVFSPEHSIVRKTFWHEAPKWVTVMPGMNPTWDSCLQTLFGHEDHVSTLAFSPDGQWLGSGSADGMVKLWHVESGICVHTLGDQVEEFGERAGGDSVAVAFSADGKSLVSMCDDGIVKVWNTATGNRVREFRAHEHSEAAIKRFISTDSSTIAYSLGGDTSVLNVKTEIPSRTFTVHAETVVGLSADGQRLASVNSGIYPFRAPVKIWNTLTGACKNVCSITGMEKVILSADGQWVASGGRTVRVWESKSGQLILTLEHDMETNDYVSVWSLAFSDDKRLLAASFGYRVYIWNTTTSALTWKSEESGSFIASLKFSPDAQRLVSGSLNNAIKVWDLPKSIESTSGSHFTQGLWYSDEHHFAVGYPETQEIGIWTRISERDNVAVTKWHEKDVCVIALSADHQRLASASSEGKITIWDMETGHHIRNLGDSAENISQIASLVFRGDGQIALGGFETIQILDTSDGTCKQTHEEGHKLNIEHMTFSIDGRWLAYTSSDRDTAPETTNLKIWDTKTEECFLVLVGKNYGIYLGSLSFSADSQLLACASHDSIYLCDVRSGTCTRKLGGYEGVVRIQARFDANMPRRLHTQFGFLDFIDPEPDCMNKRESKEDCVNSGDLGKVENTSGTGILGETPSFRGYGFSYDLDWFLLDGHRLIQVPLDYRTDEWSKEITPVINGSAVTWISRTGRLVRLHFTPQR